MVEVNGVLLEAPLPTTDDPSQQCYIDGCRNVAQLTCRWSNHPCRCSKEGGCGRRYCQVHMAKLKPFVEKKGHGVKHVQRIYVCINCKDEVKRDVKSNRTCCQCCCCLLFVLPCILFFLAIVLSAALSGNSSSTSYSSSYYNGGYYDSYYSGN